MGSYILQREKYLSKVVELRSEGMGYGIISKIIPVPEETIRRCCVKFAPTTQQVHNPTSSQHDEEISTDKSLRDKSAAGAS
jgi:hypothetical protein